MVSKNLTQITHIAETAKEKSTNDKRESLFYLLKTQKYWNIVEELKESAEEINEYVETTTPSQITEAKNIANAFFWKEWIDIEKYFRNGDLLKLYRKRPIREQEQIEERYDMYQNIKEIIQEKEEYIEF